MRMSQDRDTRSLTITTKKSIFRDRGVPYAHGIVHALFSYELDHAGIVATATYSGRAGARRRISVPIFNIAGGEEAI